MKTLLLLFLSTFCIINVFAQNPVIVSGRVIDEKDKTDIPFATVQAFVKETGTLVTGAVTDENGRFNIFGLQKGQYILTPYYHLVIGYKIKFLFHQTLKHK